MAYLSNLIVAGNSKFLNKIYAGDLEVSGTFGTTGNVSVGGNLSVTGTSTCTGGITVSGESTFNDKVNFKGNGIEISRSMPYIDFHFNNSTADYTSRIIEENSGIITIKPNLVVGSSATIPTATITIGTISNATIGSGIITDLNVMDTLRATHYDLQTVAQLGGAFYVSPTVKFPTASNANIVVTKSGSTLTMTITDTSTITSTTMAGVVWQANAKIKASGKIGTVTTGTMDGTVTAVNVNSHSMTISVSGGNANAVQAGTYNKADIDNFCVMMYHTGSNPVGIMMNSYGTNGLTYIDIYGGSATSTYTTPNVRIGNLGGLTFNGSTLSNQWGIYTNNGYFSGKIIANGGTIGGFTIGDTAIYTGTLTSATDNYIGLSTADFTRSIGGTSRTGLRMAIGDKFGVTGDGIVYSSNLQATGGNIGGWIINPTTLSKNSTQKQTEGYIQYGAILQAPTESVIESTASSVAFGVRQRTYTNGAYTSWTYPFLVQYDGRILATNADISGKITATSGSISGSLVTSGINANNITAGTISIERLTSIKVGGRNLLLNTAISEENLDKIHATENYCSVVTEDNKTVYKLTGYNTIHLFNNTNSWDCTSEKLEANTTYTYSAMIKCNKSVDFNFSSLGHFNVSNSNSTQNDKTHEDIVSERIYTPSTITANQWTKISITFTTNSLSGSSFGVYPIYNTGTDTILYIYNCKLEKGNKPTDWSPAPEDIDADIQQVQDNLDNLEVGGRNLIPYSKNLKSFTNENSTRVTVTYTEDSCTIKNIYGSTRYGIFYDIEVEPNATYTLSFYASDISSTYTNYAIGNRTSGQTASWSDITGGFQQIVEGKTICTFIVPETVTLVRIYFCVGILNGTCTIKNVKLEKGNKATDWTPAPEDLQTDINLALSQSVEYIIGTQTATTSSWTGTSSTLTELKDGTQIRYWLPYAGSGNATLNLTLKDGTTTGAINIYRQGGSANSSGVVTANRVTTHYPAGSSISMTYGVNRVVSAVYSGTTYTGTFTGWFVDSAYDSGNTYNRVRMQNAIKAVTAITSGKIICGTNSGYKNISVNTSFDLSYPLLYAASNINVNATGDNNYLQINGVNASSNGTITSGAANKMLYLKGTVNGNEFTIAPSPFMTTVTPTAVDNYVYIPLGIMYSATSIYFISSDKLYAFKDGSFRELSRGEASLAAKTATNYIYYDTINGLILSDSASSQTYAGASQGYNTQLTNNALNIRKNTTILASYGDEITFRKDGNIIASYGDEIILGNKTPTADVPNPIYMKITSNSMELYKQVSSSSFSNLFSVGYGDAVHRRNETSSEHGMYLTLNENNHLVSSEYITAFDMTSSTSDVLVQLRATIKDTDSSTSDESTDIIEIKPTAENSTAYTAYDNEYKGVLGSSDFTVDYSLDKITINETNKVMTFIANYGTQYNIYIWVSYFATNTNDIYHFDLGKRNSNTSFGNYSLITGLNNTASNTFGVSMGQDNKNAGYRAIVNGYSNEIAQNASCASVFGEGLKTVRQGSMVIGRYNAYDNGLFVVGNGTDNNNRQDAFVIRDKGKVYIYGDYASLIVTPNNNNANGVNGGAVTLNPSLQFDSLKGYSLKNNGGKLTIYSTPSKKKQGTEQSNYGQSLYIESYYSQVSNTNIYSGLISGSYDIQTTGYTMSSLTSADTSYVATPSSSSPNRIIRKNGIVVVEIEFTPKKATTAWQTIFTVPSGFRPFITHRNTVQGTTFLFFNTGNVQASTALTTTAYHFYMVYPCKFD